MVTPVQWAMRRTVRDTELLGYYIPKGTNVIAYPGMNHRLPEIWTDPEKFDPDRFAEPRYEHKRHRYAFAPFGGGAHKCIGMVFGQLEVKTDHAPAAAQVPTRADRGPVTKPSRTTAACRSRWTACRSCCARCANALTAPRNCMPAVKVRSSSTVLESPRKRRYPCFGAQAAVSSRFAQAMTARSADCVGSSDQPIAHWDWAPSEPRTNVAVCSPAGT